MVLLVDVAGREEFTEFAENLLGVDLGKLFAQLCIADGVAVVDVHAFEDSHYLIIIQLHVETFDSRLELREINRAAGVGINHSEDDAEIDLLVSHVSLYFLLGVFGLVLVLDFFNLPELLLALNCTEARLSDVGSSSVRGTLRNCLLDSIVSVGLVFELLSET